MALERLLYPSAQGRPHTDRAEPDWATIDAELRRKGVTLELLWIEYKREKEVAPIALRPHPYEFFLYYDV